MITWIDIWLLIPVTQSPPPRPSDNGIPVVAEHVWLQGVHVGRPLLTDGAVDGVGPPVLAVNMPPHFGLPVGDVGTVGTHELGPAVLVGHLHYVAMIIAAAAAAHVEDQEAWKILENSPVLKWQTSLCFMFLPKQTKFVKV